MASKRKGSIGSTATQKPENLSPRIRDLTKAVLDLTNKPDSVSPQIKALTKAVINLTSILDIGQSAIKNAIEKKHSLQEKVGDHIMIDLLQQTQLLEKLTVEQKWDRIVYAVESAIEEYTQTDKKFEWYDVDGVFDIQKALQMLSGESNE
jgi:predicted transcriptional regulator